MRTVATLVRQVPLSLGMIYGGRQPNNTAAIVYQSAVARASLILYGGLAFAADAEEGPLIDQVKAERLALDLPALNALIDEEKWDSVRSVLKVAPVNTAWEQSQKLKNPLRKLADLRDDVELLEQVDEVAAALQLADQYLYSNTFIYTQPGNGKVKFKEPKQQLKIAADKIASFTS